MQVKIWGRGAAGFSKKKSGGAGSAQRAAVWARLAVITLFPEKSITSIGMINRFVNTCEKLWRIKS